MSGLTLTLKPREKFLVGGNVVENGPRRSSIRISDDSVFVLRLSDALHPEKINTPVRRAYHAAQRILACEISPEEGRADLANHLADLTPIFGRAGQQVLMARINDALAQSRYYGVLVGLKSLLSVEAALLADASADPLPFQDASSEFAESVVARGR